MGKSKKVLSHSIGVIRGRGQLTIPDSIRAQRTWASPNSVVTISSNHPEEIIIKPHRKQQYDWDKIWAAIRRARAIKGKERRSLSKFIIEDRHRH